LIVKISRSITQITSTKVITFDKYLNLIYHRILFIIKAIDELVQDLVLDNRSN